MRAGADSRNVAAVGVLLTCVSGFGFYSLTVYESALTHAFSLGTVSRGSALFLLTSGLGGTVVGALLDRLDVRAVLAGGAACMAGGLLLLGSASGPLALYAAYLLLGLGQAGAGVVPGLSLITRWYDVQRRKLAMTLASTGLSVGGIAVAPLVARGLRHHPLGEVTTAAALVLLALCLSAAAAVTPSPTQQHSVLEAAVDGVLRAEAVRLPVFWLVSAAQTCATFAQVGGLTHLFALVAEHRSAGLAGEAVSCVALGSFSGRFLGGLVLARTSTATFYRGLLVLQAATLALLPVEHGSAALLATAALFGLTI
ncbi:MAG: MFS transporter, partial [Mycobacteriales bacterium]